MIKDLQYKNFHSYKISECGHITNGKKILKPFFDKDGYQRITLRVNKKQKKIHVHRLVYSVFVGDLQKGMVVCHIDGNILNNHYLNLKQATQKQNISDKLFHGTWQAGDAHPMVKYSDEIVENLQKIIGQNKDKKLKFFVQTTGYSKNFVYDVIKGRRKTKAQRVQERIKNEIVCWN